MKTGKRENRFRVCVFTGLLAALLFSPVWAADGVVKSKGQTLYVPVYSHVLQGERSRPFNLTATLSVRNADPSNSITVLSADYHDSKGKLIRRYVKDPIRLDPLASTEFIVKESDTSGGLGASFLVRWKSDKQVVAPVVESVMIGTAAAQGISFVEGARVIAE